jgi:hypothetical protein
MYSCLYITQSKESNGSLWLRKQYHKGDKPVAWEVALDDGGHLKSYELIATVPAVDEKGIDIKSARPAAHEHTEISNISTDIMSLPGSLQWEDDMEMYSHFLDRKVDDISQTVSV